MHPFKIAPQSCWICVNSLSEMLSIINWSQYLAFIKLLNQFPLSYCKHSTSLSLISVQFIECNFHEIILAQRYFVWQSIWMYRLTRFKWKRILLLISSEKQTLEYVGIIIWLILLFLIDRSNNQHTTFVVVVYTVIPRRMKPN